MCAIFGAIKYKGYFNETDWSNFRDLTNLVSYRGPDGSGFFCTDYNTQVEQNKESFNLFFGHRRLSIIDLSSQGAQPMKKSGQVISFNGEIFNFIELKRELIGLGVIFETNTDTEVILKLYETFGEQGFSKMNGMWAFCIYDIVNKKIILSRDRFSKKPLFYYQKNSVFYFSSEIKQLLPLLKVKEPNRNLLVNYLKQGILDFNSETFFESIFRVESKTSLTIDLNTFQSKVFKYWHYDFQTHCNNPEEEFRFLLEDSVKIRMRSDVPVGCMLSGGLDSSSISLIAHNLNSEIETFSVISDDKKMSEEPYIDLLLDNSNMRNYKMNFNAHDVINNFDKVLFHQDEPFFNLSVLASYSILKHIKDETNIVVLLNGQGGDELLLGYLKYFFFYQKDLIKHGQYLKVINLVSSALFNGTVLNQFNFGKAKRYMPKYLSKSNSYITDCKVDLINTWSFQDIRDRQIMDIDKYSIPSLCRYEDRNSTANSLEMRVPFLDYRIVNFCLNLNNDLKIKNGWTKYLLRKVMNDLPKGIRYRRDKKGFTIPEKSFLKNELRNDILSIGKFSMLNEFGILNKNNFNKYYSDFLQDKGSYTEFTDISRVYIAEKWAQQHFNN